VGKALRCDLLTHLMEISQGVDLLRSASGRSWQRHTTTWPPFPRPSLPRRMPARASPCIHRYVYGLRVCVMRLGRPGLLVTPLRSGHLPRRGESICLGTCPALVLGVLLIEMLPADQTCEKSTPPVPTPGGKVYSSRVQLHGLGTLG